MQMPYTRFRIPEKSKSFSFLPVSEIRHPVSEIRNYCCYLLQLFVYLPRFPEAARNCLVHIAEIEPEFLLVFFHR